MKRIFIGFIFVFLDFTITLDYSKIGLIPDFIGYIVMVNGLTEMAVESPQFAKGKPFAIGMAVYTGVLYLLDLLGVTSSTSIISMIRSLGSTSISLYISYTIVMGVKELEGKYHTLLNGDSLKTAWTLLLVFTLLATVTVLLIVISILFIIAALIVSIYFLVCLNKSKNLYYATVGNRLY